MVFISASGDAVKASDVDREFSRGKLEKRFGAFRSGGDFGLNAIPEKNYRREPLGIATPLKAEFEQTRIIATEARTTRLAEIREERRRRLAAIRAASRAERLQIRRLPVGKYAKRKLHNAIKAKFHRERTALRGEMRRQREAAMRDHPHHTWLSWLQEQAAAGRQEAIRTLRARAFGLARKAGAALRGDDPLRSDRSRPGAAGAALRGDDAADPGLLPGRIVDGVTKRGTVIYRVGDDALRDDGESFRLSRAAGQSTAVLALKLAKERYGDTLRIDGDRAFWERMLQAAIAGQLDIRFADPSLETRRTETIRAQAYPAARPKPRGNELT